MSGVRLVISYFVGLLLCLLKMAVHVEDWTTIITICLVFVGSPFFLRAFVYILSSENFNVTRPSIQSGPQHVY